MAVQFTPFAAWAIKYGTAAAIGFFAARRLPLGRLPAPVELELDRAPQGLRLRRAPLQITGSLRAMKDVQVGRVGSKLRLDAAALMRLRVRRIV